MGSASFHLMVVHIPIILVPLATLMLLVSIFTNSFNLKPVARLLLILAAFAAVGAFLSGEGAEEVVEDIVGVSESAIEAHEDLAVFALWLTILTGLLSLLSSIPKFSSAMGRGPLSALFLIAAIGSSGVLGWTGHKGGLIRHQQEMGFGESGSLIAHEDGANSQSQQSNHGQKEEEEDDDD